MEKPEAEWVQFICKHLLEMERVYGTPAWLLKLREKKTEGQK